MPVQLFWYFLVILSWISSQYHSSHYSDSQLIVTITFPSSDVFIHLGSSLVSIGLCSVDKYVALVGIDARFNIWSVVDVWGRSYHCGDSGVSCSSSEFGGMYFPSPLLVFCAICAGSSAGMSSCSNVCHSGVSSTSEVVLISLCLALGECMLSVCIMCPLVPSAFIHVLDCVALLGGSGGSVCI